MKRFLLSLFLLFFLFSPSLFSQPRDWGNSGSVRIRWSDATTEFRDSVRAAIGDSINVLSPSITRISSYGSGLLNSAAIQEAIDSSNASSQNLIIFIDDTVAVDDTIYVKTNTYIYGNGPKSVLKRASGYRGAVFLTSTDPVENITIKTLKIEAGESDTTSLTSGNAYGPWFNFQGSKINNLLLEDLVIDSLITPWDLSSTQETTPNNYAVIRNVTVYSTFYRLDGGNPINPETAKEGYPLPGGGVSTSARQPNPAIDIGDWGRVLWEDNNWFGCTFKCEVGGVNQNAYQLTMRGGSLQYTGQSNTFLRTGSSGTIFNVLIDGVTFRQNRLDGGLKGAIGIGTSFSLPATYHGEIRVVNCLFDNSDVGLYMGGEQGDGIVNRAIIANNIFYGDSTMRPLVVDASEVIIEGNVFEKSHAFMASVLGDRVIVKGNLFKDGARQNMLTSVESRIVASDTIIGGQLVSAGDTLLPDYKAPNDEPDLTAGLFLNDLSVGIITDNIFDGGGSDTVVAIKADSSLENAHIYFQLGQTADTIIISNNIFKSQNSDWVTWPIKFNWSSGQPEKFPRQVYIQNNLVADTFYTLDSQVHWVDLPTTAMGSDSNMAKVVVKNNMLPEKYSTILDPGNITLWYSRQHDIIHVSDESQPNFQAVLLNGAYGMTWWIDKRNASDMTVDVHAADKIIGKTLGADSVFSDPGLYKIFFTSDSTLWISK